MEYTTKQKAMIATCSDLAFISTTSTALRFFYRLHTRVGLWWDDWFALIAQISSYALCAVLVVDARCGLSQHRNDFTAEQFEANVECFLKSLYIVEPFYACCMPAVKLSILLLYWRLFNAVHWMRVSIYTTATMVLLWMLGAQGAGVFQCRPIEKFWHPLMPGTCIDGSVYLKTITSLNLLTDAIVLVMPMPLVWRLQASLKQRASLVAGFAIGGFVSLITFIRIEYLNNPHDPDPLYAATKGPIWMAAEVSLAVVCANLPLMYSLFKRLFSRVVKTLRTVSRDSSHSHAMHDGREQYELGTRRYAEASQGKTTLAQQWPKAVSKEPEAIDEHASESSDAGILAPHQIYVRTDYHVDVHDASATPPRSASCVKIWA